MAKASAARSRSTRRRRGDPSPAVVGLSSTTRASAGAGTSRASTSCAATGAAAALVLRNRFLELDVAALELADNRLELVERLLEAHGIDIVRGLGHRSFLQISADHQGAHVHRGGHGQRPQVIAALEQRNNFV